MSHANSTPQDNGEARRNNANSLSNGSETDDAFASAALGNTSDQQPQPVNAGFDSFAMTSLQSTAAAILAVQQLQSSSQYQFEHDSGLVYASSGITSGSESEAGLSRKASVSRRDSHGQGGKSSGMEKSHVERHMWSSEETQALVDGCNKHGIGNWKAILSDEQFNDKFLGRTAGDLKDRFRTYFPDAYHELYPNAKTHTSRAVRSKAPDGTSIFGKGKTKERRPFTPAEDEVLKSGYMRFGSHWAIIAKESVFEGKRKSTDLRDRFRNAFPNLYEQAGYKPRTKITKKERRQSSTGSHSDNPSAFLHVDSASNTSRPSLPPRSETSASAHSQAVSEHSEEDESDFDSHLPESTEASFFGLGGDASLQVASIPVAMSRSHSHDLSASAQSLPQENASGTTSPPNGSTLFPASTTKQPLRRSHSSKRAQAKVHNLEQAVKSASIKCNKEALLASHQHVHHQHQQQKQQQQQQQQLQSLQQQQPNAMLNVWQDRFAWEQSANGAGDGELANMDLDQMGEIINAHSAAQLLDSASAATEANGAATTASASAPESLEMGDSSSANVNANNAFLANLYRELGLYGQGAPSSARTVAVDSFQDLLDPLGPAHGVLGSQWNSTNNASSTFSPWTPVSSSAAPQQEVSSPASAQRRDHEHNQWAGDLLHRGNFATLEEWNPDAFVNMANMQLGMGNLMSQSRPTEAGRTGALPSTTGQRPPSQSLQGVQASTLPTPAQSLSMPSVHDLLSKSTSRSVSNPTRAGDEASESLLQSAYRNPYPYPADDLSLINSSLGGNMTLFPSLVGNDGQTNEGAFNAGGLSRRRRSTDTLRENAFQNGTGQSWRSTLDSLAAEQAAIVAGMSEDAGAEQRRESSFSHHGGDERAPSLSSTDDHDAPSRAASAGNLDLQGDSMRDNGLYAESLPDPSPHDGFGDAHTGPSAFPNAQHMQMSFDDMDLPSFLNRSPSFAHASANAVNGNLFSSPRMSSLVQDNTNWLKLAGATMRGQREGADAPRSVSGGHGQATASEGGAGSASGNTMAQFSAASFGDAGALDRLEHLYLEVGGGGQTTSYSAGGNTAGQQSGAQRFAINNGNSLFVPFERAFSGTGGGDAGSGYESV